MAATPQTANVAKAVFLSFITLTIRGFATPVN
jgi:hypothetical protein